MPSGFPFDWYWRSSDGRVFASARQVIVGEDDEAFRAFAAAGGAPAPLPGDESKTALQALLSSYGLFVCLKTYAAH